MAGTTVGPPSTVTIRRLPSLHCLLLGTNYISTGSFFFCSPPRDVGLIALLFTLEQEKEQEEGQKGQKEDQAHWRQEKEEQAEQEEQGQEEQEQEEARGGWGRRMGSSCCRAGACQSQQHTQTLLWQQHDRSIGCKNDAVLAAVLST